MSDLSVTLAALARGRSQLSVNSYFDDGGSWFFSSHDIPILIGAAAGMYLVVAIHR